MNIRSILTAAVCAVGSFSLVTYLATPGYLNAVEPAVGLAMFQQNALTVDGVEMTLVLDPKPQGDGPLTVPPDFQMRLNLVLRNTTDHNIRVNPTISVVSRSLADMISRVPRSSDELWHYEASEELAAGELRTVPLGFDRSLQPRSIVSAILISGSQRVAPVNFTVSAGDAPALAATR